VHRLLDEPPDGACSLSPHQPDQSLSNRHTEDEQGETPDEVDNRKRRW